MVQCPVCDSNKEECKLTYEGEVQILSAPFIAVLKKTQEEINKHNIKSTIRLAISGRKKKDYDEAGEFSLPTIPTVFNPAMIQETKFPHNQSVSKKYIFGFPGIFGTNLFLNANGTKTRLWYEATDSLFVGGVPDMYHPPENLLTGEYKRIILSVPYDLIQKKWKHYVITEFKDLSDPTQYDPDNIAKIATNLILKICESNTILQKECQYVVYDRKMPKNCKISDFVVLQRKP